VTEAIRSVNRAAAVLRAVAAGGSSGVRQVDIVEATGLQKTTAHRLLTTLVDIGWLDQDVETGAFHVGLPMVEFGLKALNRNGLLDIANPSLLRLAGKTGDTVYFSVRSGAEALCIDRVTGSFPIRTLTLRVGDRRPLGLALAPATPPYPAPESAATWDAIKVARRLGYAVNDGGVVPGAVGVGVPVFSARREPVAALSVAAVESRLGPGRMPEVGASLQEEASVVAAALERLAPGINSAGMRRLLPQDD
jgi:DNA-binding IclR family transcriptional regulator